MTTSGFITELFPAVNSFCSIHRNGDFQVSTPKVIQDSHRNSGFDDTLENAIIHTRRLYIISVVLIL